MVDINNLTLGQLKEINNLFNAAQGKLEFAVSEMDSHQDCNHD